MIPTRNSKLQSILFLTTLALAAGPLRAAFVTNPSFEDNYTTSGNGGETPTGWTVSGSWGVNQMTPSADNPFYNSGTLIADRDRFAFNWHGGVLSQEITNLVVGKQYWVQFWYASRNCCTPPANSIDLGVTFDGAPVGVVNGAQVAVNGFVFASFAFTPTNTSGILAFTDTVVNDATAELDAISMVQRDTGNIVLMNPSFEASGPPTCVTGNPPGTDCGEIIQPALLAGWTWNTNLTGTYGISLDGGIYADNGAIPDQDLVGFISGPGSLSQTVSALTPNTQYQLTFSYNAGAGPGVNARLQVIVAGTVIDDESVAPVGGASPYHTKTVNFTPTSTNAVLTFAQTNATATLLLDNIQVVGKVQQNYPLAFSPSTLEIEATQVVPIQVTVPSGFLASSAADINISSPGPGVVGIVGAGTNGVLTVHFAQGATNTQTFQVVGVGRGASGLTVTATPGLEVVQVPTVTVFTSFVLNPSFEDSAAGAMPISAWTGGTAVQSSSGPDFDNGMLPDASQVAVLKGTSTLSQQVYAFQPGKNYWLQFRYNASFSDSGADVFAIDLTVKLGGKVLAAINDIIPVGFSVGDVPFYFTNLVFVPTNASELLEFDTVPSSSGTSPALLLDAVNIVQRDTNEVVIDNPSFEAGGVSHGLNGQYNGPVEGWSVAGTCGANSSPLGPIADNGITPDQSEVLFIYASGSASNQISGLTVGQVYTLWFRPNSREGSNVTYSVAFGDLPLLNSQMIAPVGDASLYYTQYLVFTNDAPANGLSFGIAPQQSCVLIDDVHLVPGLRVPPQVVSETPAPGSSSASQPPLQFIVAQGSYPLATNTLRLLLNGVNVAASATVTPTNNPPGIVVSYAYPTLPLGSNSVELIVSDQNSPPFTLDTTYTFVTLPRPALSISLAAGTVVITWPASATGFVLQETSALPSGWTNSTATVNTQGSLNAVDITPAKVKFYRLQQ